MAVHPIPGELRGGERIRFTEQVTDWFTVFAQPGDTGTVIKYWPHDNYYTVENDVERRPGYQQFNCDCHYVEVE